MTLPAVLPGVPPVVVTGESTAEAARLAAAAQAAADAAEATSDALSDSLDNLTTTAVTREGAAIVDDATGKELLGFEHNGDARVNGIKLNRVEPDDNDILEILGFEGAGRRVLAVNTATGEVIIGQLDQGSINRLAASLSTSSGLTFGGDISTGKLRITFTHGQSLAVGGGQDFTDVSTNGTIPVRHHAPTPRTLMFSYGLCGSENTSIDAATLGDLVEARENWKLPRGLGQTGGQAFMLQSEALQRERGVLDYQLYFTHGQGGQSITALDTGSTPFTNGAVALAAAVDKAREYSLDPVFNGTIWVQGEQDRADSMAQATYEGLLSSLQADLDTAYQAILPRADAYPLFVAVLSAKVDTSPGADEPGDIAKAQVAESRTNSDIYCVGSNYHAPRVDGVHLTADGYDWVMESAAWCVDQVEVGGDTGFEPCWINSVSRVGSTITIEVNVPNGNLVIDTAQLEEATDYGFAYSGANITNVSVGTTTANTCDITITLDASAGGTLSYAWETTPVARSASGEFPHSGAWGNIRDGGGAEIPSQVLPGKIVANWLIPFEETVA